MRIGVDGYPLARQTKAGIGYYTYYLLKNVSAIDTENEYFLYNNLSKRIEIPHHNLVLALSSNKNLINRFSTSWMLFNAKQQLTKDKIDIFWGTQGIIPPNLSKSIKSLVTVHDLTFYLYPSTMALDNYFVNRFLFRKSIINADRVITISHSTAEDLKNIFKNEDIGRKTSVIYNGVDSDKFKLLDKKVTKEYIKNKFDISESFILFVGTIEPRKNISSLLKAFKILKTKYGISHQLVLAGAMGWRTHQIFKDFKKLSFKEREVKFLGYVEEEDLIKLYCGADLLVIPSFYEGFGIPAIEAVACGVPVVASDIAVFREVLGEAAVFAEPTEYAHIAECVYSVLTNLELRQRLIKDGITRSRLFSWGESAEKLLALFKTLA